MSRLPHTPVATVLAVLVMAGSLGAARADAATVRSCANLTVNGGKVFGRSTLLVKVLGPVTCAKGHSVVRAWYRRIAAGKCVIGGNFCALNLPGGWSCSIIPAAQERYTGGAPLSCARGSARVRMYPTKLTLNGFRSADREVWCTIDKRQTFCVAAKPDRNPREHGATMLSDGTVTLCHVEHPSLAASCTQNWDSQAPLLLPGQTTQVDGFRCTAKTERNHLHPHDRRRQGQGIRHQRHRRPHHRRRLSNRHPGRRRQAQRIVDNGRGHHRPRGPMCSPLRGQWPMRAVTQSHPASALSSQPSTGESLRAPLPASPRGVARWVLPAHSRARACERRAGGPRRGAHQHETH